MKKLVLASAFVLGFAITANAQTEKTTTTKTTTKTEQPAKQYKMIDRTTVAPAALEKIGTKYGGYSILEAHQAGDGEYKLILSSAEGKKSTAYFSANGDFIREE